MERTERIPEDFGYGEEHVMLRREARRVLEAECDTAAVRRIIETERGWDETLWGRAAELGWLGLAIPEAHGGSGMSMVGLATLMEEMGRVLLPSPFLGTLFATLVIREAASEAQQAAWLPAIARGERKAAVASLEADGGWDPRVVAATARREGDRVVLRGAKALVIDAPSADLIVGSFREEAGASLFAVEATAPGVTIAKDALVDPTRRSGWVELADVAAFEEARIGPAGGANDVLARVMPRVLTALAAEMVGGAERVLQTTVGYAKVREQFGRPIGAFQAVKHPLVNMMVDIEMTRSLVYRAAAALDHAAAGVGRDPAFAGPSRAERLARMAKALASDTYANAAAKAVQLHGGIGFTWECDVHLYFRRAMWSKAAFGDAAHHRRWIADLLLGA